MNSVETKLFFIFLTQISKIISLVALSTLSAHSQLSHSPFFCLGTVSAVSASLNPLSAVSQLLPKLRARQSRKYFVLFFSDFVSFKDYWVGSGKSK